MCSLGNRLATAATSVATVKPRVQAWLVSGLWGQKLTTSALLLPQTVASRKIQLERRVPTLLTLSPNEKRTELR